MRSHLDRHLKIHDGYKCDVEDCAHVAATWSLHRKHKVAEHGAGKGTDIKA